MDIGIAGIEDAEEVGSGGSSIVYRARQVDLDRHVAVKVLTVRFGAGDDAERRRFAREQRALGRLSDLPGIVPLYQSGFTALEQPYLVMPYYRAGSLQQRLDTDGPLPWEEASRLMAVVGRAVQRAHEHDVLHRDIKPANIMIDRDGRPLVGDFGVARLLGSTTVFQSRALLATPAYSPPEVFAGDEASTSVDVYGLGASLFALVNGSPAFISESGDMNVLALMRRVDFDPVPDLRPAGVPSEVAAVIERSMEKAPGDRHASAQRWVADLEAATAATTATAIRPDAADGSAEVQDDSKEGGIVAASGASTGAGDVRDRPTSESASVDGASISGDIVDARQLADSQSEVRSTGSTDDEAAGAASAGGATAEHADDGDAGRPPVSARTPDPALERFRAQPGTMDGPGAAEPVSARARRLWSAHPGAVASVVLVVVLSGTTLLVALTNDGDSAPGGDGTLTIGTVLPESGQIAPIGVPQIEAVELAIADINDAGGVLGGRVELIPGDSGFAPAVARDTVETALSQGADAILGPADSNISLEVIPLTFENQVVQCSASNTSLNISDMENTDFYFRTAPPDRAGAQVFVEQIGSDGRSNVAIVAGEGDGNGVARLIENALTEDARSVATHQYDPNTSSLDALVDEVRASEPDALVILNFAEARTFMSKVTEAGFPTDAMYGSDAFFDPTLQDDVGVDVEGFKVIGPAGGPEFNERLSTVRDVSGSRGNVLFGGQAYDCAVVISLAALAAGTDRPSDFVHEIGDVTRGGTECVSFGECKAMIEDDVDIDYTGASGALDLDGIDPTSGRYAIGQFLGGSLEVVGAQDVDVPSE